MEDIVCNRCSLLCDDVQAEIGGKEVKSLGLCRLGHTHLERVARTPRIEAISREGGKENNLDFDEALAKAAEMLISAKHPLLYGWARCTNETISEGLSLAKTLKAVFDSSTSMGLSQSMSHNLHNMKLETDLEAVHNKGEFILYWGSNPVESSHRHASRFTVFPRGEKVPQGVESRVIGVIDVRETETMKMANHRIIIPHGKDSELARALIDDLTGKTPLKKTIVGLTAITMVSLSQALRKSDFTILFYGSGLVNSGTTMENLSALAELVQTLRNLGKNAYAMPMWHETNGLGVIKLLSRHAEKPASLDFASGKPVSTGMDTNLQKLAKREYDVALVVGSDALSFLPGRAAKGLANMKSIYIGSPGGLMDHEAHLSLRVTDDIMTGSGTLTRVDMKDFQLKTWGGRKQPPQNVFDVITQLHQLIQTKLKAKNSGDR
jgi:formylmethanofuran dehydrogenase subunit B